MKSNRTDGLSEHLQLNDEMKYCRTTVFAINTTLTMFTFLTYLSTLYLNLKRLSGVFLPLAYVVRTTGGYVFTGVCLFNFWGGTPFQVRMGGTPSQVWMVGGTPSQVWMVGVSNPRSG